MRVGRGHPASMSMACCCWNAAKAIFCSIVGGGRASGASAPASMRMVDGSRRAAVGLLVLARAWREWVSGTGEATGEGVAS